jgi:hypothetical protein
VQELFTEGYELESIPQRTAEFDGWVLRRMFMAIISSLEGDVNRFEEGHEDGSA